MENLLQQNVGSIINECNNNHMERGGMPLDDAVGIDCKKGATTENQGSTVKYMG